MPQKKKPVTELPTDSAIRKLLFPKKVVDKAKQVAHEKDDPKQQKPKPKK